MSTISNISNYARTTSTSNDYSLQTNKTTGKSTLTMDDYFQLLAAQLRYQDSSNPMSNSEMMAQLTQMATIEAMNTLSQVSTTTYAVGMVGKEVEVAVANQTTGEVTRQQGVVTGVSLYGDSPMVYVDGIPYSLSSIMVVGNTKETTNDSTNNGTNHDTNNNIDSSKEDATTSTEVTNS
ncbi:MAG: hypothetical protein IAC13_09135 [Firmicutes bacterium]|uniref:Flagellar hook capping protein n=1 Tax=Candidatus Scybalomonas excrementavium TaxID=2840943 RepID=A0A9D9I1T5_9FIRM|nr:hypothetical protein [Candidatus Scybalomonas excrementavium]